MSTASSKELKITPHLLRFQFNFPTGKEMCFVDWQKACTPPLCCAGPQIGCCWWCHVSPPHPPTYLSPTQILQSWKFPAHSITHVSLAPTHVCLLVRPLVTLSDFQSVSVSGRPTWKVEERGPQLFLCIFRKCDGRTDQRTNRHTWVGARDTCVSKNSWKWKQMWLIGYSLFAVHLWL